MRRARVSVRGWMAVLAALVSALSLVIGVRPAAGDTLPPAGDPATVSATALPTWQVNGVVWSQAVVGTTVFVVGDFTHARPPGTAEGDPASIQARNFFAYDITTGNPVLKYQHYFSAPTYAVTVSADTSRIYVGGDFPRIDGLARAHLAAIDIATGAVIQDFQPSVDARVSALAVLGDTLYVGGSFTQANGQPRASLAAVSSAGTLLNWAPTGDGNAVLSMVAVPGGSRILVGGRVRKINGSTVNGMGALNPSTGALMSWPINQVIPQTAGAVTSLRTDGQFVYGTNYSGGGFEGPWSATPDGRVNWLADCLGDTYDIAPTSDVTYVVGHSHDCSMIGAFP